MAAGVTASRSALLGEIERLEDRLSAVERERSEIQERLHQVRAQLAQLRAPPLVPGEATTPWPTSPPIPPAKKIALFRSLFRGRDDVYPKLWINLKKGTKGYAPACENEWESGICEKPRVKCGECPNQGFLSVTDRVVQDHLQGKHVIGVYPMMPDETCWLLAADFDKGDWIDDVRAFVETCREAGVPCAIERSRSGNGAHVWFFFDAPVPAVIARRMGCFLLTETMSGRHQVPMVSYDRLFPNQDTMPKGGFGNLIALPLQHGPRQQGNTVFVDDELVPIEDQWGFLAALTRMSPTTVEDIARAASKQGRVIGLRFREPDAAAENDEPWSRPPSRTRTAVRGQEPLPQTVHAVLSQRLFVTTEGLPSSMINEIKRLAAFPNPEFYKKQRMRLPTFQTPRVIACAEDFPHHVALPRGCLSDLEQLLDEHCSHLVLEDQREEGTPVGLTFQGRLTGLQEQAVDALFNHDSALFVAPPGVGKTVVGVYLIAARARNTLVLVHRRPLMEQWVAQLSMFLGLAPGEIGRIGAGKHKPTGRVDVAMIQSLVRGDSVNDLVARYGHVVVDECHHVPAVSFERVLAELKARFITGLTATPHRRDGHHPILHLQIGPIRFAVDPRSQAAQRPFAQTLVVRETAFRLENATVSTGIHDIYRALAADDERNALIISDIAAALREGRSPIVLTERREHLELLATALGRISGNVIVMQGGSGAKERRAVIERLTAAPDGESRVVVATGRYAGEGFDDARLDTLFLAMPVSWKGSVIQYTGRLHRLHPGKREVRIYDYFDRGVPMLARMFEKRLRAYRAIGYRSEGAQTSNGRPGEPEFDDAVPEGGLSDPRGAADEGT